MNKIFKVIFNQSTQTWTVVSELAKSATKVKSQSLSAPVVSQTTNASNSHLSKYGKLSIISVLALSSLYADVAWGALNVKGAGGGNGDGVAWGTNSRADADRTIALGFAAEAQQTGSIAIGGDTRATGNQSIAIGGSAQANAGAVALGNNAKALHNNTVAVGASAEAKNGEAAVAVGNNAQAFATRAAALGAGAQALGASSTAIGHNAKAQRESATAVGRQAQATQEASALGYNAKATAQNSLALGSNTQATGANSVAIGNKAETQNATAVAVGYLAKALADRAIAIGGKGAKSTEAAKEDSIAIGSNAKANTKYSIVFGAGALSAKGITTQDGEGSVIIGYKAQEVQSQIGGYGLGKNNVLIGREAYAMGDTVVGIGYRASAFAQGSVAIGHQAQALGSGPSSNGSGPWGSDIAIGNKAASYNQNAIALGSGAKAGVEWNHNRGNQTTDGTAAFQGLGVIAIGANARAILGGAIAIGRDAQNLSTGNSIAFGTSAKTYTGYSIAIGDNAQAGTAGTENKQNKSKDDKQSSVATAVGYKAKATKAYASAFGGQAEALGKYSIAIGHGSKANADGAIVIGHTAQASQADAIALGSGSVADRQAFAKNSVSAVPNSNGTAAQNKVYAPTDAASAENTAITNTAKSTRGAVSVGKSSGNGAFTRQITNVAAGSADSDAANIAQLKAVAKLAQQSGGYEITVKDDNNTSITINKNNATLTIKGGTTVTNSKNITVTKAANGNTLEIKLAEQLSGLTSITTQTLISTGDATFHQGIILGSQGPKITNDNDAIKIMAKNGQDTAKITHLADGDLTDNSTDAVTGKQLHQVKQTADAALSSLDILDDNSGKISLDKQNKQLKLIGKQDVANNNHKNLKVTKQGTDTLAFELNQELKGLTGITTNTLTVSQQATFKNGLTVESGKTTLAKLEVQDNATFKNQAEFQQGLKVTGMLNADKLTVTDSSTISNLTATILNSTTATIDTLTAKNTITAQQGVNLNGGSGEIQANENKAVSGDKVHKFVTEQVNSAGFKIEEKGVQKANITSGKVVNFVDGDLTTVSVTDNQGKTEVKYSVVTQEIGSDNQGNAQLQGGQTGSKGVAKSSEVIAAINNSGFFLQVNDGNAQRIKNAETVTLKQGENIEVKTTADKQITISLNKTLKGLDSIHTKGLKATGFAQLDSVVANTVLVRHGATFQGIARFNNQAIFSRNAQFNRDIDVRGTVSANTAKIANLETTQATISKLTAQLAEIQAKLTAKELEVTDNATVKQTLTVEGSTELKDNATMHKNLIVKGQTDLKGLSADSATFNDNIRAQKNLTIGEQLTVTGKTELKDEVTAKKGLTVEGETTFKGKVIFDDEVVINKVVQDTTTANANITEKLTTKNFEASGEATFKDHVDLQAGAIVDGELNVDDVVATGTINANGIEAAAAEITQLTVNEKIEAKKGIDLGTGSGEIKDNEKKAVSGEVVAKTIDNLKNTGFKIKVSDKEHTVKLGETVEFKAGNELTVEQKDGVITYGLTKQIKEAIEAAQKLTNSGVVGGNNKDQTGKEVEGATANGKGSQATGKDSTATGTNAQATADGATASGAGSQATGEQSTATGQNAQATGNNATASGANSKATADGATANGAGSQATGTQSTANGAGAKATKSNSTATGADAKALGDNSTANGQGAIASGNDSTATGQNAQATADGATASGAGSQATGEQSTATGQNAQATGNNATASGANSKATADGATASGAGSQATGEQSTATGQNAQATGNNATASGANSKATADGATASGAGSQATGEQSTATGQNAQATGNNATASGANSKATADGATASGAGSQATG
ncbi:ESPR-type extended signal peptide-containing protein, partial [Nicoletella semolina]